MSLTKGFPWKWESLSFNGYSVAGQTTSLFFNNAKIAFDLGQGLPFTFNAKLYCLTHLHADHGAGINYVLSQRSLYRLPEVPILLPASTVDKVQRIIQLWEQLEGFNFKYQLIPVTEDFTFDLAGNYQIRVFPTQHRVDSFGYLVYLKKKKLKLEFHGLDQKQIQEIKQRGFKIEEEILDPLFCFTGDTQIEFISSHKDIMRTPLLFTECTYLDEKKSREKTRKWGHIHLNEIIDHFDDFKNKHISLIHLSARYSTSEAEQILKDKLPQSLRERVSIFPRPF